MKLILVVLSYHVSNDLLPQPKETKAVRHQVSKRGWRSMTHGLILWSGKVLLPRLKSRHDGRIRVSAASVAKAQNPSFSHFKGELKGGTWDEETRLYHQQDRYFNSWYLNFCTCKMGISPMTQEPGNSQLSLDHPPHSISK